MSSYKSTQRWRFKARRWITRYGGDKCQCCGYNTYTGNLVFHHISDDKVDDVCRLINATASWDIIIEEANKCVLVCCNCHGEIHAGLRECPQINHRERKAALDRILSEQPIPKTQQRHSCICGTSIDGNHKYCSQKCHHHSTERINWPNDLPNLVQKSSKRAVALQLGVSDKAVAKRLLNHHKSQ